MSKNISLKNIAYSIDGRVIFTDVSFKCTQTERLCLFGENGAGKSTLMKLLAGDLQSDSGRIEMTGHVRFAYVPQEFSAISSMQTVEQYVATGAGVQLMGSVLTTAYGLGHDFKSQLQVVCGKLSGGQQKILALATALAVRPDYLLLDEPENHLDIISRAALIKLLVAYTGGIIFVSHDRLLIDSLATKIGELVDGNFYLSAGGYDEYIQTKLDRIGGLQRTYDAEEKRIKQLQKAMIILQQKAFLGKDVAQYRARKAELENLKAAHKNTARPTDKKTKIKLGQKDDALHTGKLLARVTEGALAFVPSQFIFKEVNLEIRSGSKIVLLGRNGSGKSSFLKCLMSDLPLTLGSVTIAPGIKIAYFDQRAAFVPGVTAIQAVQDKLSIGEIAAMSILASVKFDAGRMKSPVDILSGGERMRLRFAITFGLQPDLLILDEPTNHIDEVTWEILLAICTEYSGTILLVSHDYQFIDKFDPAIFWVIHAATITARAKALADLVAEMCVAKVRK